MTAQKPKLSLTKLDKADLSKGRHVLIVESPESRRAVSLNDNVFTIGRHPHNDLMIRDSLASRHHATVAWMKYTEGNKSDYAYWIIDGKGKRKRSLNGIFINGTKKSLHRLTSGDIILIGSNIKISYNYISYNTNSSQFLKYCETDKEGYQPISYQDNSYKDTAIIDKTIIENTIAINNNLEDSTIIENTIVSDNNLEDSTIIEDTIIAQQQNSD